MALIKGDNEAKWNKGYALLPKLDFGNIVADEPGTVQEINSPKAGRIGKVEGNTLGRTEDGRVFLTLGGLDPAAVQTRGVGYALCGFRKGDKGAAFHAGGLCIELTNPNAIAEAEAIMELVKMACEAFRNGELDEYVEEINGGGAKREAAPERRSGLLSGKPKTKARAGKKA